MLGFILTFYISFSVLNRAIQILIFNLMPTKIVTEAQILRCLSNTPLQLEITFLTTTTHQCKNTPPEHLKTFYKTFEDVKHQKYDGMIITGFY
jgi:homoserine O-succinyltransferase